MLSVKTELDSITSFIASERDEYTQRDLLNRNLKALIGLTVLKNVEEYKDDADYDALIQNDSNGELLKLIGLYMSTPTPQLANVYAQSILAHLTRLMTRYWKREVEDAIEEKINYYQDREEKEDEGYEMFRTKAA